MRRRATAISATDLDQRLPPAGDNDELGRLGRTLNEMLARIQASVARERSFFSDASHELRSPLAMLRTELELIARERPTGPALQSAAGSAIEETERLSRLTDDLLLLARADDHQLALRQGRASASELLHQAGDRVRPQVAAAEIQVSVDVPGDAYLDVDRDRIAQALDNLVANALRYARSHVELSARAQGASLELHVTDDGPGPIQLPAPCVGALRARRRCAHRRRRRPRTRHSAHHRRSARRHHPGREPPQWRRRRLDHPALRRRSGPLSGADPQ